MKIRNMSCDLETYSSVNLAKAGVYRYAESSDFEILLFAYSADGGPVQQVDLANGEHLPAEIIAALEDNSVTKWAYNAAFERICLSRFLGYPTGQYLNPQSWRCTMVWAATMGLPLSLEGAGAVLGLEKQKLTEGKELIRYFCQPCTPTKTNGQRARNLPAHSPDRWLAFKKYNIRDVETETSIQVRLSQYPVLDSVWDEYRIDQEINDRGVALDMELVRQAIQMDARSRSELTAAMRELTALDNPNSVQQMKLWLAEGGMETDTLGKKAVAELLKTAPPEMRKALALRQQLAKSSVKKYRAMETAVCTDGRARGMFQFYGANRTGRWAGRIIQMQNLPQNHLPDLENARALVRAGDYETLGMLYDSVPDVLSELIRTAFVPQSGRKFIVADFSAIEARVIAWLAGETWRQEVFTSGKDIYCASASQMFGVPVEKHGANSHLRQKGKIAELALGYGGSVGALKAMGALDMGLNEDELLPLVTAWRQANPKIVQLWQAVDRAVMEAVTRKITIRTHGIAFSCRSGMLFITLPSGRSLAYVKPKIGANRFGGSCITYEGVGGTKKWERIESYGPKFVENCIAAGTLVITDRGCVPIEQVQPDMLVWDGETFVHHDGLACRGYQKTFSVDGVHMTPDHRILTTEGWMKCSEADNRFDWAAVLLPDGFENCTVHHNARNRQNDAAVPSGARVAHRISVHPTGIEETVYDLLNCGPGHRFAVWDGCKARIVSNCVQAISRDVLCYAMKTLRNCDIVMHIHDELVIEADRKMSLQAVCEQMSRTPPWAEGLLLRADGYETDFYKKD